MWWDIESVECCEKGLWVYFVKGLFPIQQNGVERLSVASAVSISL